MVCVLIIVCLIYFFHSTGIITVAPGVELTVGRRYALTVEATDNGSLPNRRCVFHSVCFTARFSVCVELRRERSSNFHSFHTH